MTLESCRCSVLAFWRANELKGLGASRLAMGRRGVIAALMYRISGAPSAVCPAVRLLKGGPVGQGDGKHGWHGAWFAGAQGELKLQVLFPDRFQSSIDSLSLQLRPGACLHVHMVAVK